jgi:diaminopimelate decarboxylase
MMNNFTEHIGIGDDRILTVDGVSCAELLDRFGSPVFVVSQSQIETNVRRFKSAIRAGYRNSEVLFSTKANNNLAVRRAFTQAGAGGDAFGYSELWITLAAGTSPELVVLNGANKTIEAIRLAIKTGTAIHLDAPEELEQVARAARDLGLRARVGVRARLLLHALDDVRSDLPLVGHEDPTSTIGRNMRERDKFGVSPTDFITLCSAAMHEPAVDLVGAHFHMGRERADASLFEVIVKEQLELVAGAKDATGWTPSYFDFGGGMAFGRPEGHGPLGLDRNVPTYEEYAEVISRTFREGIRQYGFGEPTLMIEPGRALASNIAILLCTVGLRKVVPETGQVWLGVDACQDHLMNTLLYACYYHPVPVVSKPGARVERVNIADPQCWYGNLVMEGDIEELTAGDQLAFLDTGAYCDSRSCNFNLLPRPAVLMAQAGNVDLIARRETLTDVLGRVRVPDRLLANPEPADGWVLWS